MVHLVSQSRTKPGDERRQYFRIKNRLFMGYELLDSDQGFSGSNEDNSKSLPFAHLLEELNALVKANNSHIESLNSQQQLTVEHLNNLNAKIAQLTQYMIQSLNLRYNDLLEVDLSGGGIRFNSDRSMVIGQKLKLELVLVPEYYYLVVYGEVVDCQPIDNGFELGIVFDQIKEADRDAIIRHVFKSQSAQLRAEKQNNSQAE